MNNLEDVVESLGKYQSYNRVVSKHEYSLYCSLMDAIRKLAKLKEGVEGDIIDSEQGDTVLYKVNDEELFRLSILPPVVGKSTDSDFSFKTMNGDNIPLKNIDTFVRSMLSC